MSVATLETRPAKPRTASDPPGEALVGTDLGNYRLQSLIGQGGMGRVYLAEHRALGRRVAIKVLRPSLSSNRMAVARFFQEAQVVNRIRHRNIVDITDFVELPDRTAFIVMELLEGQSLRDLHKQSGPLPLALVLDIVGQVCEALEATHGIGVVHRDLKPGNVFVCDDRAHRAWVKLLDFGVAKLADVSLEAAEPGMSAPHTAEGAVLGTPAYMSPEQAVGEPLDGRSDVYAIGTILYELVCGAPPFTAKRFVDYVHMHAAQTPRPLTDTESGAHAPAALQAIILRCLEKRPERRYQDVGSLRLALADVQAWLAGAAPERPRRRTVWWAAAAALGLAAGATAFVLRSGVDKPQPAPAITAPAITAPAPTPEPTPAPAPVVTPLDAGPAVVDTAPPETTEPPAATRRPPKKRRRATRPKPVVVEPAAVEPSEPTPPPVVEQPRPRGDEVDPAAIHNPFKD